MENNDNWSNQFVEWASGTKYMIRNQQTSTTSQQLLNFPWRLNRKINNCSFYCAVLFE